MQLVDIDELSYRQAADALGIPIGTVVSRLHRARTRLRASLTGGARDHEPDFSLGPSACSSCIFRQRRTDSVSGGLARSRFSSEKFP